MLQKREWPDTL